MIARLRNLPSSRRIPSILLVAALAALPLWGAGSTAASAQSCSFVSSAATQAYDGGALLAEGHNSTVLWQNQEWEAIPAGPAGSPKFIWATDESEEPLNATFVQQTTGACVGFGTLYINVDNDAVAYWNGAPVWECRDTPLCFQDSYRVSILFVPGVNTLAVYAQNDCCWGSTYVNPAMLQFRVDGPP
jgi:hypothetical protein